MCPSGRYLNELSNKNAKIMLESLKYTPFCRSHRCAGSRVLKYILYFLNCCFFNRCSKLNYPNQLQYLENLSYIHDSAVVRTVCKIKKNQLSKHNENISLFCRDKKDKPFLKSHNIPIVQFNNAKSNSSYEIN